MEDRAKLTKAAAVVHEILRRAEAILGHDAMDTSNVVKGQAILQAGFVNLCEEIYDTSAAGLEHKHVFDRSITTIYDLMHKLKKRKLATAAMEEEEEA